MLDSVSPSPFIRAVGLFVLLLTMCGSQSGFADCGPQEHLQAQSENGDWKLEVTFAPSPHFTLLRDGKATKSGPMEITGHHVRGFVGNDGGIFVLLDSYEGLAVYDSTGRRVNVLTPEELLTARELKARPGRWPCHPEGRWAAETNPVVLRDGKTTVEVFTHLDRRIVIDQQSGQIVSADPEIVSAIPDTSPIGIATIFAVALTALGITGIWYWTKRRRFADPNLNGIELR